MYTKPAKAYNPTRLLNWFAKARKYGMRRKIAQATGHIIPEQIRLPDGREIATQTLREQVTNRVNYNLRTGTAYTYRGKFKIARPVDTESKS